MLIISISGTFVSFLMMAFARSGLMLFAARALDGLTAGNIPVASAVISDTTAPKDRAKGFGIIGAAFGFGFVFGPAISAFTFQSGESIPFLIAAFVSLVAAIITWLVLPETNTHEHEIVKSKLFDFKKLTTSIFDRAVGATLTISLLYSFAFALFIFAYQPFAVKVLMMNPTMIAVNFTALGVVGLITQGFLIRTIVKEGNEHHVMWYALLIMIAAFSGMFFIRSMYLFIALTMLFALANSFVAPLVQTLLSKEMDAKSQGSILGLNASYISIGTIFSPIIGGVAASYFIESPFLLAALIISSCLIFVRRISMRNKPIGHAF